MHEGPAGRRVEANAKSMDVAEHVPKVVLDPYVRSAAFCGDAVLGTVNARRFAPPAPRPSGVDEASARRASGHLRDRPSLKSSLANDHEITMMSL